MDDFPSIFKYGLKIITNSFPSPFTLYFRDSLQFDTRSHVFSPVWFHDSSFCCLAFWNNISDETSKFSKLTDLRPGSPKFCSQHFGLFKRSSFYIQTFKASRNAYQDEFGVTEVLFWLNTKAFIKLLQWFKFHWYTIKLEPNRGKCDNFVFGVSSISCSNFLTWKLKYSKFHFRSNFMCYRKKWNCCPKCGWIFILSTAILNCLREADHQPKQNYRKISFIENYKCRVLSNRVDLFYKNILIILCFNE